MADWLEDLAEFAAPHVAEACKEWRRTQSKRPTPADIRKLALQHQSDHGARPEPIKRTAEAIPSMVNQAQILARDAEYAAASASRDAFARSHGYPDFRAWLRDPWPRAPLPPRFPSRFDREQPKGRPLKRSEINAELGIKPAQEIEAP